VYLIEDDLMDDFMVRVSWMLIDLHNKCSSQVFDDLFLDVLSECFIKVVLIACYILE
jgi:hypothetical protein